LSVIVETVIEAFCLVEERLISHEFHELTEELGPHPVATVVLEGDDELQQFDFCQSADAVLPEEVEDYELVELHSVTHSTRHYLSLQCDPLIADVLHQLLRVLPGQHLSRLVLF
jgi:hypothetical protein